MRKFIFSAAVAITAICANAQVNSPGDNGYHTRGIMMYQDRNYVGCIDQMKHLKSMQPSDRQAEDADYYIAMSSAHLAKSDAPALLKLFLWKYPTSPRRDLVRLTIADLLLDSGSYGEALDLYLRINPDALDGASAQQLAYNKAFCMLKRCEYDAALPIFQSLSSSNKYSNGARFYQGYIAYVKGDYRTAVDLLRKVDTSKAPANMADYYLAQIHFMQGDYSNAAATARKLMNSNVDADFKLEAQRIAGESLYQLGNDSEAIPLLRKYADSTPEPLPSALYIIGVDDYRNGSYENAIRRLTPVAALDNAMGQSANLYIGQAFMHDNNYNSAIIAFEKALRSDFDSDVRETAFYNYAVAKTQGGKIPFGSSVTTFEEFLRNYPDSRYAPAIGEYIVSGYMTDNNYPAALASIETIKNPSPAILKAKQQVLYTLGTRELTSGNSAAAVSHLTEASRLASHNPSIGAETDLWLGEALYAQGKYDDAARKYNAYLTNKAATADNKPQAHYALAYSRFSAGKYDDAIADFNSFINNAGRSSNETVADAYNRLGDCFYYKTDFGRAENAYGKAFSISPATGDYALFQQSLMKGLTRNYTGKIDGMRAMIQKFPGSGLVPQALLEIGESYSQLNQPDKTIETYSMVASRYPATEQGRKASLLLALTYLNNGNRDQAVATYKSLIAEAPRSEEGLRAMENLKQLMADEGSLAEYARFIKDIPGAVQIDSSELERLSFEAAERDYLNNGTIRLLTDYIAEYPDGASNAAALGYLIDANAKYGNEDAVMQYADLLIDRHPHSPLITDALGAKANTLYNRGMMQQALDTYRSMLASASTPYATNAARIGIIRTALPLGAYSDVIEAAEALTASSTVSAEQRSEARLSRGIALSHSGDLKAAAAEWSDLATNLDDINGTKAAFLLAEQQFNHGDLKEARKNAMRLADSPFDYWYARSYILISDIDRKEGKTYEADGALQSLRENYPGSENDIFEMIDMRLNKQQ